VIQGSDVWQSVEAIELCLNLLSATGTDSIGGFVEVVMRIIKADDKTSKANRRWREEKLRNQNTFGHG
jgi:hypothetical protein